MLSIKHLDDWLALELNEVFPNKPSPVPPPVSLRAKPSPGCALSSSGRSRRAGLGGEVKSDIDVSRDAFMVLLWIFKLGKNHCAGHISIPACAPSRLQATGPFS